MKNVQKLWESNHNRMLLVQPLEKLFEMLLRFFRAMIPTAWQPTTAAKGRPLPSWSDAGTSTRPGMRSMKSLARHQLSTSAPGSPREVNPHRWRTWCNQVVPPQPPSNHWGGSTHKKPSASLMLSACPPLCATCICLNSTASKGSNSSELCSRSPHFLAQQKFMGRQLNRTFWTKSLTLICPVPFSSSASNWSAHLPRWTVTRSFTVTTHRISQSWDDNPMMTSYQNASGSTFWPYRPTTSCLTPTKKLFAKRRTCSTDAIGAMAESTARLTSWTGKKTGVKRVSWPLEVVHHATHGSQRNYILLHENFKETESTSTCLHMIYYICIYMYIHMLYIYYTYTVHVLFLCIIYMYIHQCMHFLHFSIYTSPRKIHGSEHRCCGWRPWAHPRCWRLTLRCWKLCCLPTRDAPRLPGDELRMLHFQQVVFVEDD